MIWNYYHAKRIRYPTKLPHFTCSKITCDEWAFKVSATLTSHHLAPRSAHTIFILNWKSGISYTDPKNNISELRIPKIDCIQKATNERRFVTVFQRARVDKFNAFDEKLNIKKAEPIMKDINAISKHCEDNPINALVPALTTSFKYDLQNMYSEFS
jgi:hypothetical protein